MVMSYCIANDANMTQRVQHRFAYLDSLRFVAAALVLIQHLFETRPESPLMPFVRLGPGVAGVALFFFISGFVIPFSAGSAFDWRVFMVRRFMRIYPLYLCALALIFVAGVTGVLPHWADMAHAPAFRWVANLALVQEFVGARPFLGVSWTLAIELIWYGLFALSLLWWRDRAAVWLDRLVPIALVAVTLLSLALATRIPLGRPTMIYAAVLGFQCYRHVAGQLDGRGLAGSILRFCLVTVFASYVAFGHFRHPHITLAQDLGPWAMSTVVFLAVVLIAPLRNAPVLNTGPIPALGAVSYSIYLLHPVVISAAERFCSPVWAVPVAIVGSLVLALVAYRLIEQPGVTIGRKLARRLFTAPTRAA